MITQLHIEPFRSIRCLSVPIRRHMAVVGAIASGKSSVLDAIAFAHRHSDCHRDVLSSDEYYRTPSVDLVADNDRSRRILWRGVGEWVLPWKRHEAILLDRVAADLDKVVHRSLSFKVNENGVPVVRIGDTTVPLGECGTGTEEVARVLSAVHHTPPWDLICIDNFGEALHPRALHELVPILRTAEQTVIATSSPYVVDGYGFDEVLVLHDGTGALLSEHPDADKWRGMMETGEFWSSVGEDWVGQLGEDRKAVQA